MESLLLVARVNHFTLEQGVFFDVLKSFNLGLNEKIKLSSLGLYLFH